MQPVLGRLSGAIPVWLILQERLCLIKFGCNGPMREQIVGANRLIQLILRFSKIKQASD
jgi:hypothetical protein